jgi:hypothetical protein
MIAAFTESAAKPALIAKQPTISVTVPKKVTVPVGVVSPITQPITQPVQVPITQPILTPITQPVQVPITQPILTPITQPITQPVQQPVMQPIQVPVTKPVQVPVPKPILAPIVIPIPERVKKKKLKKIVPKKALLKAWQPYIRRKGVWIRIGKPLPKHKAIKKGEKIVRTTLAAAFKVRPRGVTAKPSLPYEPSPKVFRKYRLRYRGRVRIPLKDTWIQKASKRLGEITERREIQIKRKQARRKKTLWL